MRYLRAVSGGRGMEGIDRVGGKADIFPGVEIKLCQLECICNAKSKCYNVETCWRKIFILLICASKLKLSQEIQRNFWGERTLTR